MPKKTTTKSHRLSNIVKPENLTLENWQIMLRQQAAAKESFGITEPAPRISPGEYIVKNPRTRSLYHVHYHGRGHRLNHCSCMDFKTSRLGTCKHLEAVKAWIETTRGKTIHLPDPSKTVLYMDYSMEPRVRISYGRRDRDTLRNLFDGLFDRNGHLAPLQSTRLLDAIREAMKNSGSFHCREDVMNYVTTSWDNNARNFRLDTIFSDKDWWKDIFVKGIIPYSYQKEGIEFAARAGRCVIADEMGLGKTLQAIGTAELLHHEGYVSSILIVCPTSLKYQWKKEIQSFTGREALVIEGGHPEEYVQAPRSFQNRFLQLPLQRHQDPWEH